MRWMLAASAILATTLLTGLALAHEGSCDDCRNRERPNIKQQVMERFTRAAPREQVPDRRFGRERPNIANKTDPREKIIDPHQASRPMVPTMSSDKPLPTNRQGARNDKSGARDWVNGQLAKKGKAVSGKKFDVDQTYGTLPLAKSIGIKLKVLQIQKPVNARPQVMPKAPCSAEGQCVNGSSNDPMPKINTQEDRPAPSFTQKTTEVRSTVETKQLTKGQVKAPLKNVRHGDLRSGELKDQGNARITDPRPQGSSKNRPDER